MNDQSKGGIGWTDFTSTPLRYRDAAGKVTWGCVRTSPGCQKCYAATLAERYGKGGKFTKAEMAGLTPYLDEKELRALLTSKKISGKKLFLNDMTDWLGEWVPDEMVATMLGVMAMRPDVTWQLLSKRAARMAEFFERWTMDNCIEAMVRFDPPLPGPLKGLVCPEEWKAVDAWPVPWIHLGVSVENQDTADERIPDLLKCPAAVRWLSVEPLLDRVDLGRYLHLGRCPSVGPAPEHFRCGMPADHGDHPCTALTPTAAPWFGMERCTWLVIGGESGAGHRPMEMTWLEKVVEQCRESATPLYVKQDSGPKPGQQGRIPDEVWALKQFPGGQP